MAHDVGGRKDALVVEIVGDVEQGGNEQLVGGRAFRLHCIARAGLGQQLRHEAALGADRNDDRVLDLLRLDQAENFGAEVLRPVGPADAAARDLAEAQMHGLDPRRIHEDFVERTRQRRGIEHAACELDGDELLRLPLGVDLVEIGADRRLHGIDEAAQDAVLVEALDRLQRRFDGGGDLGGARRALVRRDLQARIEARAEQPHARRRRSAPA